MAVCRKRELFRIWKQSQNEEDRKKYCMAEKDTGRVVCMTMNQKAWEAVDKVDLGHDGGVCLELPCQRVGEKKDDAGVRCLKWWFHRCDTGQSEVNFLLKYMYQI